MDYQQLLLDHLDLVAQIVRMTGGRRHLSAAERDDFASFVNFRLVENDYAILRKFKNRSAVKTYLVAVIERLSLDFCTEKWGRWRPTAMAERLGPVAIILERLVTRDNHTVEEAIEIVRTSHYAGQSDAELRRIWDQLPVRMRTTEVAEEAALGVMSDDNSEVGVDDADFRKSIERLQGALKTAFDQIAARDRVLLALRFDQEMSIIEIARLTGSSVPTLHRRFENSVKQLRLALTRAGFNPREIAGLIGHHSIALSPLLRAEVESFLGSVRLFKRDG